MVAHRTSPTNIGLALLGNLAAYDFGYLSLGRSLERTAQTLRTMQGLERYRGHLYNWYDTRSLAPLHPRYISTVDSGNLAGLLLTLRAGLLELPDRTPVPARLLGGLTDTLHVLSQVARAPDGATDGRSGRAARGVRVRAQALAGELKSAPRTLAGTYALLQRLVATAAELVASLDAESRRQP